MDIRRGWLYTGMRRNYPKDTGTPWHIGFVASNGDLETFDTNHPVDASDVGGPTWPFVFLSICFAFSLHMLFGDFFGKDATMV